MLCSTFHGLLYLSLILSNSVYGQDNAAEDGVNILENDSPQISVIGTGTNLIRGTLPLLDANLIARAIIEGSLSEDSFDGTEFRNGRNENLQTVKNQKTDVNVTGADSGVSIKGLYFSPTRVGKPVNKNKDKDKINDASSQSSGNMQTSSSSASSVSSVSIDSSNSGQISSQSNSLSSSENQAGSSASSVGNGISGVQTNSDLLENNAQGGKPGFAAGLIQNLLSGINNKKPSPSNGNEGGFSELLANAVSSALSNNQISDTSGNTASNSQSGSFLGNLAGLAGSTIANAIVNYQKTHGLNSQINNDMNNGQFTGQFMPGVIGIGGGFPNYGGSNTFETPDRYSNMNSQSNSNLQSFDGQSTSTNTEQNANNLLSAIIGTVNGNNQNLLSYGQMNSPSIPNSLTGGQTFNQGQNFASLMTTTQNNGFMNANGFSNGMGNSVSDIPVNIVTTPRPFINNFKPATNQQTNSNLFNGDQTTFTQGQNFVSGSTQNNGFINQNGVGSIGSDIAVNVLTTPRPIGNNFIQPVSQGSQNLGYFGVSNTQTQSQVQTQNQNQANNNMASNFEGQGNLFNKKPILGNMPFMGPLIGNRPNFNNQNTLGTSGQSNINLNRPILRPQPVRTGQNTKPVGSQLTTNNAGGTLASGSSSSSFQTDVVNSVSSLLSTNKQFLQQLNKIQANNLNQAILAHQGIHKAPFYPGMIYVKPLVVSNAVTTANALVSAAGGFAAGFVPVIIGIGGNGIPTVLANIKLNKPGYNGNQGTNVGVNSNSNSFLLSSPTITINSPNNKIRPTNIGARPANIQTNSQLFSGSANGYLNSFSTDGNSAGLFNNKNTNAQLSGNKPSVGGNLFNNANTQSENTAFNANTQFLQGSGNFGNLLSNLNAQVNKNKVSQGGNSAGTFSNTNSQLNSNKVTQGGNIDGLFNTYNGQPNGNSYSQGGNMAGLFNNANSQFNVNSLTQGNSLNNANQQSNYNPFLQGSSNNNAGAQSLGATSSMSNSNSQSTSGSFSQAGSLSGLFSNADPQSNANSLLEGGNMSGLFANSNGNSLSQIRPTQRPLISTSKPIFSTELTNQFSNGFFKGDAASINSAKQSGKALARAINSFLNTN